METIDLDNTPLYKAVCEYAPSARFHIPGHSGEPISPIFASARFDITELDFSDNLLSPSGVIAQAESLMASACGAENTLFFTGGATSALFAAILAVSKRVDRFGIIGYVHRSIINALEIFGAEYEKYDPNDLPQSAQAIIVTSPDYYGNVFPIDVRDRFPDAIIIVDEAHGAHFVYSDLLPKSAVTWGDLVIQSMHKTMPAFGGAALLHVKSAFYEDAINARSKLHTTSPSYLVMASMDYARALFLKNGEEYYKKIKQAIDGLVLPERFEIVKNDDFSRVVIQVPEDVCAFDVGEEYRRKGVYFELVDSKRLVAVVTPFNYDKSALLSEVNRTTAKPLVDYSYLLGKRATKDIILYPPGSLIVPKGGIIDQKALDIITKERGNILGL